MLKTLLFFFFLCGTSCGYKILVVFSFPRPSHGILGEGYVRHLLNAGHEVTYIAAVPTKKYASVRQVDISSIYDPSAVAKNYNFTNFVRHQQQHFVRMPPGSALFTPANLTIFHENLQKLIHDPKEEFDVVVAEWMFKELVGCGLAAVFNCPLIWSTSMETINPFMTLLQSTMNPAYTNNGLPKEDPPFTFWRRLVGLYEFCLYHVHLWLQKDIEEDLFKRAFGAAVAKRGRTLPSFQEARYNASLILGNSYVSTGIAMTLPQNYKQIGGYHVEDTVIPLPKDLQKIMDDSHYGVIYFSLGSFLQTKDAPDEVKEGLMKVFAGLKQTVIWKFEANFSRVPPNVHLMKWTPQQSILAHKNCILFITHGGQLSLIEALHHEVPVIGIPLFADQITNVKRAAKKGFGKAVTLSTNLAKDLKVAIEDVLGNPRYMKKAKEYSQIHHNRLVSPGKELVFWVEHVIKTRGALHLRPPATTVPLYQKLYLDFLALIVVIVYVVIKIVRCLFGCVKMERKLKEA